MSSSTLSSSLVLFFFFFICRPTPFFQPPNTQDSYSSLDSSSFSSFLPSSASSNIQTHFSKSQKSRSQNWSKNPNPKSWSRHWSAMGLTISAPERLGFVFCVFWFGLSLDLFSVSFGLVCLWWNIFCCGFVLSGLMFWVFFCWLVYLCFLGCCFGFVFSTLVSVVFSRLLFWVCIFCVGLCYVF